MFYLIRFFSKGVLLVLLAIAPLVRGQTFESLHSFIPSEGAGSWAELVRGSDGNFYGTASSGGDTNVFAFGYGTIFKVMPDGTVANLASFNNTNGASPRTPVMQAVDGHLYGTTYSGGESNMGTVYRVTTNGVLTRLLSFTNANGSFPLAGLAQGSDGNFFGSTSSGGANGFGTIFKVAPNGELTTLVSFSGTNGAALGASPRGTLVRGNDGEFYGTTYLGGINNLGTAFKVTTNGVLTTLFSFTVETGRNPSSAKLAFGRDDNLYGTTFLGGSSNVGTVFQMTTNGAVTTLASFAVTNGSYPQGGVVQGFDGNFYGTTSQGGMTNSGTVFQITPDGILTTLFSFTASTNGVTPLGGFAQDSGGNLYSTTFSGGNGIGTVYRIMFPSLSSRVSGNEMVIFWPTNFTGFSLQSSVDLNPPFNWINASNAPVILNGQFVVTNSTSGSARFYRLKK